MKQTSSIFLVFFSGLFFLSSCKKETTNNLFAKPPIAQAGNSLTIQLPVNSVSLTGKATTTNTNVVGYLWSLVSGPNVPIISSPSSATTTITELIAGNYIYQFAVVDNTGLTGIDTVSILVNPAIPKMITLQPTNNPFEGHIDSYSPNAVFSNGDSQFDITAWTANGSPENQRACLKIDFNEIPAKSIIDSAILYLFATPLPHGGNGVDANFGNSNRGIIQRITNVWPGTGNLYTWNNQPNVTTLNQITIPQSTSSTSNTILNVSLLVKDMQQFGNNGFFMQLQNEQPYNIQQFASSFNTNTALHPKLVIWYR